ncbi:MAG: MotA/TolQ/ExbB proton channel family protein [bacterium]
MYGGFNQAWSFFLKGGPLAWPILACSLIALAVIIERWWVYRRAVISAAGWQSSFFSKLSGGDLEGARTKLPARRSPSARVLEALLERVRSNHFSRSDLEKTANHLGSREVRELERHLPTLSTIGNIAPLLGLTGTVLGMVKAFMSIESMGGKVNASVLAGGIWEALLTTLFGLAVAIPAVIAHNILSARVQRLAGEIQDQAVEFIETVGQMQEKDDAFVQEDEPELKSAKEREPEFSDVKGGRHG